MSVSTPPDVLPRPQKLSMVEAFKTAPALVKVLVASFCLPVLFVLAQSVAMFLEAGATQDRFRGVLQIVACVGVLVAIVLALVGFLLGKSIARGAHAAWLLALAPYCLVVPFLLFMFANGVTVPYILVVVITVTMLTLLLAPAVRRHCAKK